jgi:ATP-dependent 26S proteasome regulatory subunit
MAGSKAKDGQVMVDEALAGILMSKPPEVRARMLLDMAASNGAGAPGVHALLTQLLQTSAGQAVAAQLAQQKALYEQALAELQEGPVRPATFIAEADGGLPGPRPRAHVITPDGQERFATLHPSIKPRSLIPGMTVYLDPKGAVVLGVSQALTEVGPQATFLRRMDGSSLVEASMGEERMVLRASQCILDVVEKGALVRGGSMVICPRRQFAFSPVAQVQDRRYRFVDRSRVQEVTASRDIGNPHWSLNWLIGRTRILLRRPDLLERFDLRPRCALLMTGPTGTGKTLTIRAYLYELQRMLVERTGREDLGSRVIRAKVPQLLSEWLGRSDKNIDELFDDIQAVASEKVQTRSGELLHLPVVVILEEAEGIARRRGELDGGIYDRILGTLLQRLDDPTDDLARLPMILITTSNRPDLIDSAMWRRLAGVRAHFGRLDREGVTAVLDKKLRPHYPYAGGNGRRAEEVRAAVIDQVVSWLYSPNGEDSGLVEITYRDGKKATRYRRDLLTGAVIEQAVASAIDQIVFQAEAGHKDAGLSAPAIMDALRRITDGLADNLTSHNAADYLDLPEHAAVALVRRLRSPTRDLAGLVARPHPDATTEP